MHSKPSNEKAFKVDSKSKKLFKARKTSSKKNSSSRSPTAPKRHPPKTCLAFYLSDQCSSVLSPFNNLPLFPKDLQRKYQDQTQMFSAFNAFNAKDTGLAPFEDHVEKMRFLSNSQETLIERFLQDKYSFSKNSANLQEIYCYTTAKNLLQSQFQEFFLKRNEFLKQMQENCEPQESKSESREENSFSTTNASSPSINNSYGLGVGQYVYPENFYSLLNCAKGCPESLLNGPGENENGGNNKSVGGEWVFLNDKFEFLGLGFFFFLKFCEILMKFSKIN